MPKKKPQPSQAELSAASREQQWSKQTRGHDVSLSAAYASTSLSQEDMANLSQFLDSSLELPTAFGEDGRAATEDWKVQDPEDIIKEAKRSIHARKPWRSEVDDSLLDKRRQTERRLDRGYHIILPDNRVRSMEEQLSRRVRAQLLGEDVPLDLGTGSSGSGSQSARTRGDDKAKARKTALRAPWYLPANEWFNKEAKKKGQEDSSIGFPYDFAILKTEGLYAKNSSPQMCVNKDGKEEELVPLTSRDKETLQGVIDEYRTFMKNHPSGPQRLPHYMQ
eukprot:TRINITY_DN120902_c0_g1_i1.p1 TRINITY_DN120902_c0_g1~~TRINITY_DN120902_c0_g1_i1.p1  ORF type:complete len:278 (-),score=71.17 TRINITY_DN120902_c0_g1_i1:127-960(-)